MWWEWALVLVLGAALGAVYVLLWRLSEASNLRRTDLPAHRDSTAHRRVNQTSPYPKMILGYGRRGGR